jgi:hypothetical protein
MNETQTLQQKIAQSVKTVNFLRNAPGVSTEQLSQVLETLRKAEEILKSSLNS